MKICKKNEMSHHKRIQGLTKDDDLMQKTPGEEGDAGEGK